MATLNALRKYALAFPATDEGKHFHLNAFRVAEKPFMVIEKDEAHAMARLDKANIRTLVDENPQLFEEVWQTGKYLIGVRFALAKISAKQLKQVIELAWRTKAPKKLIRAFHGQ